MKTLIMTGASSRIAEELAKTLDGKVKVLRVDRSDSDMNFDFTKASDVKAFVAKLHELKPEYLFLNHGVLVGKRLTQYSETEERTTLAVNLVSYLSILESLVNLPGLRTVVTSSISGSAGSFDTLYASTKAGVDIAVRSLAKRLPPTSRLNAVAPGIISDAKMTLVRQDRDVLEKKRQATPTGKFTEARDVAGLVKYLLMENENVNGEIVHMNGGLYT